MKPQAVAKTEPTPKAKSVEQKAALVETPAQKTTRPAKPLTPDEERLLKPKDTFKECAECPEMVVVPAGSFMMGSPEGTQRKITIARPFAVARFEATFAEWDACVSAGGCKHKPYDSGWGRGNLPVINVSLDDDSASAEHRSRDQS